MSHDMGRSSLLESNGRRSVGDSILPQLRARIQSSRSVAATAAFFIKLLPTTRLHVLSASMSEKKRSQSRQMNRRERSRAGDLPRTHRPPRVPARWPAFSDTCELFWLHTRLPHAYRDCFTHNAGMATKKCTEKSEWSLNEAGTAAWTNYSACKVVLDAEIQDDSKQFEVRRLGRGE